MQCAVCTVRYSPDEPCTYSCRIEFNRYITMFNQSVDHESCALPSGPGFTAYIHAIGNSEVFSCQPVTILVQLAIKIVASKLV